jgi:hypothetical protein
MVTTALLLVLALTPEAIAAPTELPAAVSQNQLQVAGTGGLSLGLPVLGWVGGRVRYDRQLDDHWTAGVLGEFSGGLGMISPRANVVVGCDLFSSRAVDLELQLYAGWPLIGLQQRFEVRPLRFRHFEWSLGESGSAELLWNLEGQVFTRIAVPMGEWTPSLKLAVEAGVGLRSAAHVGPALELVVARRF